MKQATLVLVFRSQVTSSLTCSSFMYVNLFLLALKLELRFLPLTVPFLLCFVFHYMVFSFCPTILCFLSFLSSTFSFSLLICQPACFFMAVVTVVPEDQYLLVVKILLQQILIQNFSNI
jgi:hypothetical protein